MRVLFTFAGGTGHLVPLLPAARALAARGHDIAFSGQKSMFPFTRVLAGLSKLDATIVTTVGEGVGPFELGRQPANGALAFGVPLLILPMGADQPLNADRATALGVATALDPLTSSSAQIARWPRRARNPLTHERIVACDPLPRTGCWPSLLPPC